MRQHSAGHGPPCHHCSCPLGCRLGCLADGCPARHPLQCRSTLICRSQEMSQLSSTLVMIPWTGGGGTLRRPRVPGRLGTRWELLYLSAALPVSVCLLRRSGLPCRNIGGGLDQRPTRTRRTPRYRPLRGKGASPLTCLRELMRPSWQPPRRRLRRWTVSKWQTRVQSLVCCKPPQKSHSSILRPRFLRPKAYSGVTDCVSTTTRLSSERALSHAGEGRPSGARCRVLFLALMLRRQDRLSLVRQSGTPMGTRGAPPLQCRLDPFSCTNSESSARLHFFNLLARAQTFKPQGASERARRRRARGGGGGGRGEG